MKNVILLFLFLLVSNNSFCQDSINIKIEQSDSLSNIGLFNSAVELLLETLKESTSPKDSFLLYAQLCGISKTNNEIQKTIKYGYKALDEKFNTFINLEPFGDVLYNLSVAKFRVGEIDSTFFYADKAIEIRQRYLSPNHKKIVQNLMALGTFHANKGNTNLSIQYKEQALSIALKISPPNYNSIVGSYFSLGSAYHSSNNLYKARDYYETSLKYYKDNLATNQALKGHIYNGIGVVLETQKDYQASQEYYREALKIFSTTDDIFSTNTVFSNIANNFTNLGRYNEAKKLHKKAILLLEGADYISELPWKYLNLGATYMETYEYDSALVVLEKAKTINETVSGGDNELSTIILNHFGSIYNELNDFEKAEKTLKKSILIAQKIFGLKDYDLGESYYLLAKNYFSQNKNEFGFTNLKLAEEALILNTNLETNFKSEIISRTLLLDIYLLREEILWRQYKSTQDTSLLNTLYNSTINTLKLSNVILDFYEHENAKLDIFKAIDKNLFYGIRASKELFDLTKDSKYTEQAFKFFEAEKSTLLKQEHKTIIARESNQINDSILQREDYLKREISQNQSLLFTENNPSSQYSTKLNTKIFNLKRELDELINDLEHNNPSYYTQKYQNLDFDIKAIQVSLNSKETLIEFYQYKDNIYAISLTNSKILFEYTSIDSLNEKISDFNSALLNSNIKEYAEFAFKFYSKLLEKHLRDKDKNQLTIIPSKSISFLSFDCLLKEQPTQLNYSKFPYLAFEKAISYKHSAKKGIDHKTNPTKLYLGICPQFNGIKLNNLSGATKEINIIAEKLNGNVLENTTNFKYDILNSMPDYKIIHFATHSLLNTEKSNYSSLLLGEDTLEAKNKLYSYEISNNQLNADLIVLSACNTGKGKLISGEGVASIARSFNYAGAKSVLVGLWALPDFSTSTIMELFFEELTQNDKSKALHNAKTRYLNTADEHLANPIFWAGLQLIGDKSKICLDQPFSRTKKLLYITSIVTILLILFRKKLS